MNTHNIYFYGEISKLPKLMMKKKNHLELCSLFAQVIEYLDFSTYHAMSRFNRQTGNMFFP